jgi:hypothetical protein
MCRLCAALLGCYGEGRRMRRVDRCVSEHRGGLCQLQDNYDFEVSMGKEKMEGYSLSVVKQRVVTKPTRHGRTLTHPIDLHYEITSQLLTHHYILVLDQRPCKRNIMQSYFLLLWIVLN